MNGTNLSKSEKVKTPMNGANLRVFINLSINDLALIWISR
jgi:hypothetical protein